MASGVIKSTTSTSTSTPEGAEMQTRPIRIRGSGCVGTNTGQHQFEEREGHDWCRQCGVVEQHPLRVSVEGGKYEVVQTAAGDVFVLRGGDQWVGLTEGMLNVFPSKMILCAAHEIRHLRALLVYCEPCRAALGEPCGDTSKGYLVTRAPCADRVTKGESTWKDLANR